MELNILFEDEWIIVCEKPIKVPSQSDKSSDFDMVNRIKNHIYECESRTNPYVGLIHRLDRPVGGIMVFAKQEMATKELNRQITEHKFTKKYLAIVTGKVEQDSSQVLLENYLIKDGKTNLSKVVSSSVKQAKKAILSYQVVADRKREEEILTLVEVNLKTGRHHQIRVQLSHVLEGIWGDTKYNHNFVGKKGWWNVALFAYELQFVHPKTKKELTFQLAPKQVPFDLFAEEIANLVNSKQK